MSDILDKDLIQKLKKYTFKVFHVLFWATLAAIGIFFKILHWPGSSLFLLLGFSGLLAYSISGLLRLRGRNILNNISFATATIWTLYVFYTYLFKKKAIFGSNGIITYIVLALIILFIYEMAYRNRKKD